jgi:hypothetical protein
LVPPGEQVPAQRGIVVDFPVQQDPDGAVFIGNRLPATADVNDAEAAVSQPHAGTHENAFIVRPAMAQGLVHPMHGLARDFGSLLVLEEPTDAAHERCSFTATAAV